jgi:hypothetical protein
MCAPPDLDRWNSSLSLLLFFFTRCTPPNGRPRPNVVNWLEMTLTKQAGLNYKNFFL